MEQWNRERRTVCIPDLSNEDIPHRLYAFVPKDLLESPGFDPSERPWDGAVNLAGIDFSQCNLIGINLRFAKLQNANLYAALFSEGESEASIGADLAGAVLKRANLTAARLYRANLFKADLRGASLKWATLDEANLGKANLIDADLSYSEPWKAYLFAESSTPATPPVASPPVAHRPDVKIDSVESLLVWLQKRAPSSSGYDVRYFRGESQSDWHLTPSVMRCERLRDSEERLLVELLSRRPQDFDGVTRAFDQWVLAQHHRLPTRLLDVTRNPLVALYHACQPTSDKRAEESDFKATPCENGCSPEGAHLHVFDVTRNMVKPFNSDCRPSAIMGHVRGVENPRV